jgi:hypothetical protein
MPGRTGNSASFSARFLAYWAFGRSFISVRFLAAALIFPRSLSPLNRGWFRLGLIFNRIVSPVIMGALFFGAVVPVGWYLRKRGKDLLSTPSGRVRIGSGVGARIVAATIGAAILHFQVRLIRRI